MRGNIVETLTGGFVLLVAVILLGFAYLRQADSNGKDYYALTAQFDRIDGVTKGSDVKVSGIKVGTVLEQTLNPQTYMAVLTLGLHKNIQIPADTVAEIASEGLLGGKFVALVPGGDDEMLKPGEEIEFTQAAVSLENMIGQLIFSSKKKGTEEGSADTDEAPEIE